ncbi:LacI family DNA-binding transcriptional regulator [Devosia sp. BSSL-BM10]|uniref:LacI family DNA-binding transcriptional regulator n=1 Tax=Devosia litorisediminis TaxID=2829817 RepID=A0A942E9U2_9HYPH|nr:LacI family DNA-binding transcriptional regulator [Devosia litorisediminis]MBS3848504.1 LacI family DNA-binding transcriptional regulator [Devosia litorisediminis]
MGKKRVTLADVAKLAGLSTSAASMIMTGRPDTRLSADAHAKVHAAAASLGYRPNVAARALRTDKSRSIALISDYVATTRFASGLIRGALAAAEAAKHVMLVLETAGEPAREIEAVEAALDRQVDGVIFAAMRAREVFVPDVSINVPIVMLNGTSARFPTAVLPDEYEGGRSAVRLLLGTGITDDIVLLGHNPDEEEGLFRSASIARRIAGVRDEMAAAGVAFAHELSCWNWEPAHGFDLVHALLKQHRPKAILCLNDRLAFGAYQALGEAGLSIPGDVSLVSFDNDELASYLRPGLTTIALPHEAMGRRAVEMLLDRNSGGEALIPMPSVIRGSLRPNDRIKNLTTSLS